MNVFLLHKNPVVCAQMHCDQHVRKMVIEYAQLLSTAHRLLDGQLIYRISKTKNGKWRRTQEYNLSDVSLNQKLYKATHWNHPSAVWARESSENYEWLFNLYVALNFEYRYRFGNWNKAVTLEDELSVLPRNISIGEKTKFKLAIKDKTIHRSTPIQFYRNFYIVDKSRFATWTKRNKPEWYKVAQMTCIVGVKHKGEVYLAGDSAGVGA